MPRRVSPTLAAVLALLGFLLVTAVFSARDNRRQEAPRKARLISLIEERRDQVEDLDAAVRQLRSDVAAAERAAARTSRRDREEGEARAILAAQAATTPLAGPGIEVRMSDSDREPPKPDDSGAFRIHDRDVQLVVNALFASGAEAVAVNGNRVAATTAIRAAGDTIVVNFRPLSPPYRIVAIGADRVAFERSEIADRFRRWTRLFGLGFTIRTLGDARVPPYTGRVGISTAEPVVGAG